MAQQGRVATIPQVSGGQVMDQGAQMHRLYDKYAYRVKWFSLCGFFYGLFEMLHALLG
jgi:hypothetical protein